MSRQADGTFKDEDLAQYVVFVVAAPSLASHANPFSGWEGEGYPLAPLLVAEHGEENQSTPVPVLCNPKGYVDGMLASANQIIASPYPTPLLGASDDSAAPSAAAPCSTLVGEAEASKGLGKDNLNKQAETTTCSAIAKAVTGDVLEIKEGDAPPPKPLCVYALYHLL